MGNQVTRLEIKNLHGYKTIDLRIVDNTLILVGENGVGKTTVLYILYYLLSGQWRSIAKYTFEEIALTIGGKRHLIKSADLDRTFVDLDPSLFSELPASLRLKFKSAIRERGITGLGPEFERLCDELGVPPSYVMRSLMLSPGAHNKRPGHVEVALDTIHLTLNAQLLFLPTYRRIEQELSLIFKGVDEREFMHRREGLLSKQGNDTYMELVEFGMKDVEKAINNTLSKLNTFARESLNKLTFGYLGDIVESQYENVNLQGIRDASDQTIFDVLNRIQEPILSSENKTHLKEIIAGVKRGDPQTSHTHLTCHYFTKLMAFQKELEEKEERIVKFCEVCNQYMVDKECAYDTSNFKFTIRSKLKRVGSPEIQLHNLSSGEKQIVSLFSHLYLSGGKSYFVLIDEPELSLSVPWQRRFLLDIRNSHFCSGLVAVTHSPFIYDNSLLAYAHGLGEFVR